MVKGSFRPGASASARSGQRKGDANSRVARDRVFPAPFHACALFHPKDRGN
jgi:hypothetical protein